MMNQINRLLINRFIISPEGRITIMNPNPMMNPIMNPMMMNQQQMYPVTEQDKRFVDQLNWNALKQEGQSHLANNNNVQWTYPNGLNQINIMQFPQIHISKAERIVSVLTEMDQLLLEATKPNVYLSPSNIDGLFYLAKNIILDYYLCKLENSNFTMKVTKQNNVIFVSQIGDKSCNISLTDMQNNLNSIKQVIGDGNKIYAC